MLRKIPAMTTDSPIPGERYREGRNKRREINEGTVKKERLEECQYRRVVVAGDIDIAAVVDVVEQRKAAQS